MCSSEPELSGRGVSYIYIAPAVYQDRPTNLTCVSIGNKGDGLRWEHKLFSSQAMLGEQSWDEVPLQNSITVQLGQDICHIVYLLHCLGSATQWYNRPCSQPCAPTY